MHPSDLRNLAYPVARRPGSRVGMELTPQTRADPFEWTPLGVRLGHSKPPPEDCAHCTTAARFPLRFTQLGRADRLGFASNLRVLGACSEAGLLSEPGSCSGVSARDRSRGG